MSLTSYRAAPPRVTAFAIGRRAAHIGHAGEAVHCLIWGRLAVHSTRCMPVQIARGRIFSLATYRRQGSHLARSIASRRAISGKRV